MLTLIFIVIAKVANILIIDLIDKHRWQAGCLDKPTTMNSMILRLNLIVPMQPINQTYLSLHLSKLSVDLLP